MTEKIQVLYVDDETMLLNLGKIYLERTREFDVTIAPGAAEAIDLLTHQSFDVIISDYQMPRMDGIEFLKYLKTEGNAIPFILFTGRGREEVVIEALNNGADFYLQKGGEPTSQFAELTNKIHYAVARWRSEQELAKSQKKTSDIIEFLPDATFAINTEGVVIAWNRAIEEMTGISKRDMIGQGDHAYTIPFYGVRRLQLLDLIDLDNEELASKYQSVQRRGNTLYAETYAPELFGGKGAYVWATGAPLFDASGNRIGAIESIRDITARKLAEDELLKKNEELQGANEEISSTHEELRSNLDKLIIQEQALRDSEEKFKTLFESAGDAILIMDNSAFLDCNKRGETMYRRTRDQILGQNPADFSPQYQPDGQISSEKMSRKIIDAFSGETQFFTWVHLHLDGTTFVVEVTLNRFSMQGTWFLQAMVRDIIDRKRVDDIISPGKQSRMKNSVCISSDKNTCDLTLSQIIDVSEVQSIITDFHKITKFPVAILDVQGNILVANGWQDICTKFHRTNTESCTNCIESDTILTQGVTAGESRLYRCKNNLCDYSTPIVVGGVHLGNFFIGQFLFDDEDLDYSLFRDQAKRYGFDEDAYIAALKKVPRCSRETVQLVMDFYTRFIHLITQVSWSNSQLERALEERNALLEAACEKEEDLHIALQKFKTLFDSFPLGISITDAEGHIIETNAESERLLNISIADHTNRWLTDTAWNIIRPDGTPMPHEEYAGVRAIQEGSPIWDVEMGVVKDDGTITWVSVSAAPLPLQHYGVVITYGDISERKRGENHLKEMNEDFASLNEELIVRDEELQEQLEEIHTAHNLLIESEALFRGLFDTMPSGAAIYSVLRDGTQGSDYIISDFNRASLSIEGKELAEVVGKSLAEIRPNIDDYGLIPIFHKVWTTGEPAYFPFKIYIDSSFSNYYENFVFRLPSGQIVAIYNDVTDRFRAEQSLFEANQKLRLLTGLTRHDIFNQLTVIDNYLILAMEEPDAAMNHGYLSEAHHASERIGKIVGFTREYENFGSSYSRWNRIASFIESAIDEVPLGNVTVENQIPDNIEVYADLIIRKVFTTILENAIRHGERVTHIRFYCTEVENTLFVTCEDDGVGIPSGEKKLIFDHGYGKNTGFGLFLSQEILSITGLSIRETGVYGEGARFEILVPVGKYRIHPEDGI